MHGTMTFKKTFVVHRLVIIGCIYLSWKSNQLFNPSCSNLFFVLFCRLYNFNMTIDWPAVVRSPSSCLPSSAATGSQFLAYSIFMRIGDPIFPVVDPRFFCQLGVYSYTKFRMRLCFIRNRSCDQLRL